MWTRHTQERHEATKKIPEKNEEKKGNKKRVYTGGHFENNEDKKTKFQLNQELHKHLTAIRDGDVQSFMNFSTEETPYSVKE